MAKVITTIVAEELDFDDICSFETEHCVGIYSSQHNTFVLIQRSNCEFNFGILPVCLSLKELDDEVYKLCDEHIVEVYDSSAYEFNLILN